MTRQEFLDALQRALNRELNAAEVEENIRYYDNYIREQVAKGQEEEQVTAQLGDPKLIARTILQVDENKASARTSVYGTEEPVFTENPDGSGYTEDQGFEHDMGTEMHTFHVSGWKVTAILIVVLLLVCIVLGTVVAVVWKLLPVILVAGAALWVYHRFFY